MEEGEPPTSSSILDASTVDKWATFHENVANRGSRGKAINSCPDNNRELNRGTNNLDNNINILSSNSSPSNRNSNRHNINSRPNNNIAATTATISTAATVVYGFR